jgi:hypothetical protein
MIELVDKLIGPVSSVLDKFIEDKDQKAALAHEIATMSERHAQEVIKGQLEINKTEAAHTSLFVAGWRPAIGWVCCLGMAGNFLIIPFLNMGLSLMETGVTVPMIELDVMMPVLMGMLGLGGLRTVEKLKGVQREK